MIHETLRLGTMALIPVVAFASEMKRRIRSEQNGRCDLCGLETKLQVHHKIPQVRGGSDRRENGVGLCEDCHARWDLISLTSNIAYPGVPYEPINRRKKSRKKGRRKKKRRRK